MRKFLPYIGSSIFLLVTTWIPAQSPCASGCDITVTSNDATNRTLNSGDTLCLWANSSSINITGNVIQKEATGLKVCSESNYSVNFSGGWSFQNDISERVIDIYGDFNRNNGTTIDRITTMTIHTGAQADFQSLSNSGSQTDIINNDTMTFTGGISYQGINSEWTNNGFITSTSNMTLNSDADLINNGTWSMDQAITFNNGQLDNNGPFIVKNGGMTINGSSALDNSSQLDINLDLVLNTADFNNEGIVDVVGNITINGVGTTVNLSGGVFIANSLTMNSGTFIAGTGGNCAAFLIKNNTTINSGITVSGGGIIEITDSTNSDTVNQNNCGAGNCGLEFSSDNSCYTVLPVEYTDFRVKTNGHLVNMTWGTAQEINSDYFLVQRSTDGIYFENLLTVKAAGSSYESRTYFAQDLNPPNNNVYYRIKQYDFDGSFSLSQIREISVSGGSHLTLFPNPVLDNDLNYVLKNVNGKMAVVELFDPNGRLVSTQRSPVEGNICAGTLPIDPEVPPGIYMVSFKLREEVLTKRVHIGL